jgi:putative membrane protein
MLTFIKRIFIGLVIGITLVIPGLSAGTMAIAFNVYDRLVEIIKPNVKKILAAWLFWLPLVIGAVIGLIFFSKLITEIFDDHPFPVMWFFIGLIVGGIPLIYRKMTKPLSPEMPSLAGSSSPAELSSSTELSSPAESSPSAQPAKSSARPSFASIVAAVLALTIMILIAVIKYIHENGSDDGMVIYTELTLRVLILLVIGGLFAGVAIIIPGISGAFLLLVLGLYMTALQAVSDLNVLILLPIFFGAVTGVFLGAGFIRFLLAKVPRETYGAVLGLVVGSIIILYPDGFGHGVTIIFSIIGLIAGATISYLMSRKEK